MNTKTSLPKKFWWSLVLFGLTGQIAWVVENMYLNVFIYKMFNASPSAISLMVGASAVTAALTTIIIGALSDRIGKRKVFICGGYILWGISIFAFSMLDLGRISLFVPTLAGASALAILITIVLDCLMTFFGSTANDAAFNAWLTDSTDSTNRGSVEGINAMMPLIAILMVFGGFMSFDLGRSESWSFIFSFIGIVTAIIGIIGFFTIKEGNTQKSETGFFKNVIYSFRPSTVAKYPRLYLYLAAFIIFNISIQIFMPYLIIYYEVSLGMTNYVLIMAPAIIIASIITAFWGKTYDKKGFFFAGAIALAALSAGFIVLYLFTQTTLVFIGSLLMMSGYLAGMAAFGAKIRDLTPQGKAGMLQGVRICSQVLIPGIAGPFIGSLVLKDAGKILNNDGTYSFVPNSGIFLAALIPIIILVVFVIALELTKPPRTQPMTTPFESEQNTALTWDEYPRPQLRRESYLSLCGEWELSAAKGEKRRDIGKITVPFPPESRISGIERKLSRKEQYIYRKSFTLPENMIDGHVILHFGAADQIARVSINGKHIGEHSGGYLPFEFDITDALISGENTVEVIICDSLDRELAYGKQRRARGGMWYTPISGLWKQVWVESVPENYIKSLKITPSLDSVHIEVSGGAEEKRIILVSEENSPEYTFSGNDIILKPENVRLWTPEDPYLYEFVLTDGTDTVRSYFALRTVSVEQISNRAYICLNGKPYFCHGLLDQGYYGDGIYTPATPDGLLYDIQKAKALGFNTLRKHIKIEHELFYYFCDKYGMLVFQDMVNSGRYSFLLDTALPTAGIKSGISHRASERRRAAFESDAKATVDLLYNHPCVIYYTIFNEGWGQYDSDRVYSMLRTCDTTRIYDTASGWFQGSESDVVSEHVYFKDLNDARLSILPNKPLCLTEFGGYSLKVDGHSFNLDKTYGYRSIKTDAEYGEAILKLYREQIIPLIERGLCASIFTQLSDVEDEVNGFLTYDRQVCKVDESKMKAISDDVIAVFKVNVPIE